ncbi:MAG: c-type cytochrome [Pirellulales bacterium]|nr:c-type cytochrome [Pirellulales bacterium]
MKLPEFINANVKSMHHVLKSLLFASLTATCAWCFADAPLQTFAKPLAPDEALKHFHLPPGLKIELVAAEPEVVDPVAAAFDEDGRLWVVEMGDYPNGPTPGLPPQSRIKRLQDRDGDGRYETSQVFADGLLFCNGLQLWRGGAIATLSGEVAYFHDGDGNGRADSPETWFQGFREENPQLRANHPTLALDHQVYVANGLRDGDIIAAREAWRHEAKPLSLSGMDFRFDPRTGQYDTVNGFGQFGLSFDDFGNRFICSNRNPCMQVVLENRYIRRNPRLALSSVVHDVSPPAENSRLFPLTRAWTTSNLHARQFTAACGVTIYRGDALPAEYRGNSFTCDPTANLVHRDVLELHEVVFDAKPNSSQADFLASSDEWFRPVDLTHGPDGALYVIDMYRAVIEHPGYMPDELKNRPENTWGNDRGRIYRIVAADHGPIQPNRLLPKLSSASQDELIALLEHPSSWHHETAARLLLERNDPSMCDKLQLMVSQGKSPHARLHALWLMQGLDRLTPELVRAALEDCDPWVRSHAVRLAEPWLNAHADLRRRVLALAHDDAAQVRFQVALSLGEILPQAQTAEAAATLAEIAIRDADNSWIRTAVATSIAESAPAVLQIVLQRAVEPDCLSRPGFSDLVLELSRLVGANQNIGEIGSAITTLEPFLKSAADTDAFLAARRDLVFKCLIGLGQGADRRGKSLAVYLPQLSDRQQQLLREVFATAAKAARNVQLDSSRRKLAIQALRYATFPIAGKLLPSLIADDRDQTIRILAIETLGAFDDPSIGPTLLAGFVHETQATRRAILNAMLEQPQRIRRLLDELEAEGITPADLQPDQWQRLATQSDEELRHRSERLHAAATPMDRQPVIDQYRRVLTMPADSERGKQVFVKNCATCHRVAELGVNVGPDISDSRTRLAEQFLVDILDPNRAIDNRYFSYSLSLTSGQIVTGIIAAETASSVTLREPDDKTRTVLREDIDTFHSNGISLMPTGLEQAISLEQMADLISFLKNWRYLEKQTAAAPATN